MDGWMDGWMDGEVLIIGKVVRWSVGVPTSLISGGLRLWALSCVALGGDLHTLGGDLHSFFFFKAFLKTRLLSIFDIL